MHGQVWEHGANLLAGYDQRQSPQQAPPHAGNGFFHPLDAAAEPTLQIGYVRLCVRFLHAWSSLLTILGA